jgi:hypothetical protein
LGRGIEPAPTPEKRSWFSRLNPFSRSEKLPEYKDPALRGLVVSVELSPQPIKLSEVRQMDVRVRITTSRNVPVTLEFPNARAIRDFAQECGRAGPDDVVG